MKLFLSSSVIETKIRGSMLCGVSFEMDGYIKLYYEDGNDIVVSSSNLKRDKNYMFTYFQMLEKQRFNQLKIKMKKNKGTK